MKTVIFMRKRREEASSIEEIFYPLRPFLGDNVEIVELPYSSGSILNIIKNIRFARRHRGDVNHICGEVHFLSIGLGKSSIITVHDVGTIITGGKLARFVKKLLWFKLPFRRCGQITCISQATYDEVKALMPKYETKLCVIHNPVSSNILKDSEDRQTAEQYSGLVEILHVGTPPRKNLERVMQVCSDIDNCKLLVLGQMSHEQKNMARDLKIDYEEFYNIDYSDVIKLYKRARLVSFPSKYEGFGMPVLEANALGVPIVVGDIPVLRDVANDAALFVNPDSDDDIKEAFQKLLSDQTLRSNLISRGKINIRRFSPEFIGKEYQNIYKKFI